jgi:hypothetical protein
MEHDQIRHEPSAMELQLLCFRTTLGDFSVQHLWGEVLPTVHDALEERKQTG